MPGEVGSVRRRLAVGIVLVICGAVASAAVGVRQLGRFEVTVMVGGMIAASWVVLLVIGVAVGYQRIRECLR
ncbi:hypothetical protein [Halalkalicoccus tibetensis]|uniref:Uncharacterized protein n=1 Tax=Halalkalicoccus tibetensis TaxID=175632 RepID=A0ABD5V189_9EURY